MRVSADEAGGDMVSYFGALTEGRPHELVKSRIHGMTGVEVIAEAAQVQVDEECEKLIRKTIAESFPGRSGGQ